MREFIGRDVPRKEGVLKVTGQARYVDDLPFDGLFGVTVRSSVPRGRIRGIFFEGNVPWDEIVSVAAKDIPGKNSVALLTLDQPFLAENEIRHVEEPILLLAHADRFVLEQARKNVRIDVEPLPPVWTLEDALAAREVIWGQDNVFKTYHLEHGDVDAAFLDRDLVTVSGEYRTGAQEQLYIEPHGVVAVASPREGVTVWGSMQCPYYVHQALVPMLGLRADQVRVVQTETGGGFGGKEEYPSLMCGHAALLAWKSGRPVKMIYSRTEDMTATTKRHPSLSRIRTAVTRDGRLVALDYEFLIDGGAYHTLSSVVLSRGTIHAAGPYVWPHVRIHSRAVATSYPPNGAFRGFGAPQSIFAMERHLNRVARTLRISPEAIRRKNFIRSGQKTATRQLISEKVDFDALLSQALEKSRYHENKKRFTLENQKNPRYRHGMGFATFMHGAGFTGSGEKYLASVVGVEVVRTGQDSGDVKIRVLSASTEIGQGTNTIFSQIVADALGLAYEDVDVAQPDTRIVPNSGPTVASRTCMIVGKLVEQAAVSLREILIQSGVLPRKHSRGELLQACRTYLEKHGSLKTTAQYQQPPGFGWDDEKYQGDAYATYAWAVYVAQVKVDLLTYETQVEDFVALQEVGRVVHPVLAAGQIEGGVAQGIGYALYEKVLWKEGRMANAQMSNYIMPTSLDLPPIRVFFEEINRHQGPSGAKGIGELPMDGPAPAILNAVEDALGVSIDSIPMLPEDLMRAIRAREMTGDSSRT